MASIASPSQDVKSHGVPVRKKVKTSDLPLASATRAAIEGLAHKFKKKGGYDSLRHEVWKDLEKSNFESEFTSSLLTVAEAELEKNTEQLLKLDRGKATLLLEGAVDRAGVYQSAEAQIDKLINAHIEEIETGIRKLRRQEIGVEAAEAEFAKGGKTDEQYAEETNKKREARESIRAEARARDRAIMEEKRREDRAKRKEEELRLEAEHERRREERKARDRAEKEREEEKVRDRDRERERDRERARDRYRDKDREKYERDPRDRSPKADRDRRSSKHQEDTNDSILSSTPADGFLRSELSQDETTRLEQEALKGLLEEGQKVSRRPRNLNIDDSLAPPPRKSGPASAINPIRRGSDSKTSAVSKTMADNPGSAIPQTNAIEGESHDRKSRGWSSSYDRASSRGSSQDTSRADSKDRDDRRQKHDRYRRDDSRARKHRDTKNRHDRRRGNSQDRQRSSRDHGYYPRSPDRRRTRESRSRTHSRSRERVRLGSPNRREMWKQAEVKKREAEAREYLAAQHEAREKGLPIPGWIDRNTAPTSRHHDEETPHDLTSTHDRDRDKNESYRMRSRSRSRSPTKRRGSRNERSASPTNIDRYIPGASGSVVVVEIEIEVIAGRDQGHEITHDEVTALEADQGIADATTGLRGIREENTRRAGTKQGRGAVVAIVIGASREIAAVTETGLEREIGVEVEALGEGEIQGSTDAFFEAYNLGPNCGLLGWG